MAVHMSIAEMTAFLDEVFPQVRDDVAIERMDAECLVMRLRVAERHLRPGGTVSGPAMFGLADVAAYVATMARIGPKALAVTTNCSIDFMRKPQAGCDILARAEVLKLGKALSVIEVRLYSEGMEAPVARAGLTYSIPPERPGRPGPVD